MAYTNTDDVHEKPADTIEKGSEKFKKDQYYIANIDVDDNDQ